MKIKDLPKVERPREKLQKYGPEKLSNSELLAILLRTGTKDANVVELSGRILKTLGARKLAQASVGDLKKLHGLGAVKACEIVACFELGKRILQNKKSEIYLTPQDVWRELKDIRTHKKEHFVVFFLDARNQEIKREVISVGTLNASMVHPRELFEPAIIHLAAQILVAHNHPSGNPEPSEEDIGITRRLVAAGNLLGIEVVDHVIVADGSFKSMKACGLV